jgi:hypothetical protein
MDVVYHFLLGRIRASEHGRFGYRYTLFILNCIPNMLNFHVVRDIATAVADVNTNLPFAHFFTLSTWAAANAAAAPECKIVSGMSIAAEADPAT